MAKKEDIIEKARTSKYQPGQAHPQHPNWVWTEVSPGKFTWKARKGAAKKNDNQQPSGQQAQSQSKQQAAEAGGTQPQAQPKQPVAQPSPQSKQGGAEGGNVKTGRALIQWAVNADIEDLKKAVEKGTRDELRTVAYRELKHRGEDVSKLKTDGMVLPKVSYKGAPNHHVHVEEKWSGRNAKTGKRVDVKREDQIKMLESKDDDGLLKILNNPNMEPNTRHLAMLEAQKRGIDESKVDLSGDRLKKFWDKEKELNSPEKEKTDEDSELEDFEDFDYGLGDFDADGFLDKFPEGDYGWDNPSDERVKEAFNLKTASGRRLYDNFLYYAKTSNPNYVPPKQQLNRLMKGYYSFTGKNNTRPMMVAAGGAGVGKTYNLRKTLNEYRNMQEYDKDVNADNDDYDYVFAPQINSLPKLAKFLNKHNGKIIIFDDNDDLLTDKDMSNVMKTLNDGNPKARFFPEYDEKGKLTGKNNTFTGKMIVLTNKSSDTLNKNEDAKAVMSRAKKMEIKFTVQENIDTLRDRYEKMDTGIKIKGMSKDEEKQLRKDIFDYIVDNKDKLDPGKFTVRKFIDIYEKAAEEYEISGLSGSSASASDDFGEAEDWRDSALEILNKAKTEDMSKQNTDDLAFVDPVDEEDMTSEEKEVMKKIDKDTENQPDETLDDREQELKREDKKTKKIKKALMSDMSLEDAENLLFGDTEF